MWKSNYFLICNISVAATVALAATADAAAATKEKNSLFYDDDDYIEILWDLQSIYCTATAAAAAAATIRQ